MHSNILVPFFDNFEIMAVFLAMKSSWQLLFSTITRHSILAILYLDFVKDVEEVVEILRKDGIKAGKYTGQMTVEDRKQSEKLFLQGDISVLVATESYELGVDNPNINQVIRIGCPRNLGVLLQELGRAGRKPGSVATGLLLFNEVIDDKRLGLWLKSALESKEANAAVDRVKSEMIRTYIQTWKFINFILYTMGNA